MLRLSAIVPATDSPPALGRCIAAVQSAEEPPEEVVVVEDEPAPGPAAARNAGALRATGDVLTFVDSDVAVHPDAFSRIRRAFAADPDLTALFGSYDDTPAANGAVSTFRNLLHHHVHQSAAGPAATFWAGLGAVRRDAFLAAGGFDADRFSSASVEDIDLGLRLGDRGARIELDPGLLGTHLKRWTLQGMVRTDLLDRGVPWTLILLRRGRASSALNLGWRHRLSAAASVLAAGSLLARRPRPALAAMAALVVLNRSFYALLWRRCGPLNAGSGVFLHLIHHLTAAIAVPVALVLHARRRREPGAGVADVDRPPLR